MAHVGQRSENSMKSYAKHIPAKKRREMSDFLAGQLKNQVPKETAESASIPPENLQAANEINIEHNVVAVNADPVEDIWPVDAQLEDYIPHGNVIKILEDIEKKKCTISAKRSITKASCTTASIAKPTSKARIKKCNTKHSKCFKQKCNAADGIVPQLKCNNKLQL